MWGESTEWRATSASATRTSPGRTSYYERTKEFWDQVRDRWSKVFAERGSVTLRGPVDKLGLFQPLFAHAEAIAEQGAAASKKNAEVIESALKAMGALDY